MRLGKQAGHRNSQIVWPNDDGQDTSPEIEVQDADGEEPEGKPKSAGGTVLFDADFLHAPIFTPNGSICDRQLVLYVALSILWPRQTAD